MERRLAGEVQETGKEVNDSVAELSWAQGKNLQHIYKRAKKITLIKGACKKKGWDLC